MNLSICLSGELPPRCAEAMNVLSTDLEIVLSESGINLCGVHGHKLEISYSKHTNCIIIIWEKPVQFYRALSLLRQHWAEDAFCIEETPCFEQRA